MPPKTSAKAQAGRAKKADNAAAKAAEAAAAAEAAEAAKWETGGKGRSKADDKAEKAAEAARKKAEKERLLREEEEALKDKAPAPAKKAGKKEPKVPAKHVERDAGGGGGIDDAFKALSADNIDDALDALELVEERTDKAAMGSKAAMIERHPERRFKAAFEAFKERELPRARKEHPGLRTQQYHDVLYKEFQKHPDNPFNQATLDYNATKEEKLALLQAKRAEVAQRLGSS